jgi:hypothetical protein
MKQLIIVGCMVNHNEGEGEWQDRMDYGKKSIF